MNQVLAVYFIIAFLTVKCEFQRNIQFKAFQSLSRTLARSCHEVSVISVNGKSNFIDFAVLPTLSNQNVPHLVVAFEGINSSENKVINTSAIIAFDSMYSLRDFNKKTFFCAEPEFNNCTTLKNDFFYPFIFIVHCPELTKDELSSLKDVDPSFESLMLRYAYFIVEEDDFINLWTFVWFTPEACNQMQLALVNKFSKKTQKWEHGNFQTDKFENFYGCTLHFSFYKNFLQYVTGTSIGSDKDCLGYLCETAKVLSRKMNFSYIVHDDPINGNVDSKLEPEMDLEWSIVTFEAVAPVLQYIHLFFSTPFAYRETFIVIPKGKDLDSYERIILPFDDATWMWLAITFAAAFTTILVRKFMNNRIQGFIIGLDTLTPGMNILRIFFGILQIKCPDRNCPRIFVMSFILFCLVIRTGYQGKMFEFLQKDLKWPTYDTIDELIDHNFTFHLRDNFKMFYGGTDFADR